jgi:enoyl-[acyl-carrier-protein] reductase (NADH)
VEKNCAVEGQHAFSASVIDTSPNYAIKGIDQRGGVLRAGAAIVLLKRFATVDEVAAMATYLVSELSSATNVAALRADGGVVRAIL